MSERVIYWLADDPEAGYDSLAELQDHYDSDMEPTAPGVHRIAKAVVVPDVWAAVSLDPDDPDCSLVTEHATKEEAEAELSRRVEALRRVEEADHAE